LRLAQCIVFGVTGNAEMTDKALPPNVECYDIPETKPDAQPNPFKIGDSVRLRDGAAANGIVRGVLGSEIRIEWEGAGGDPQWYHQDYVVAEKKQAERVRAPAPEERPRAKPNPFKIGDFVRLRDGAFTNGIVMGILGSEVRIEWQGVAGDPQWHHQDYVAAEKRQAERVLAPRESQSAQDVVGQACRLVARMDDNQRRRFLAHIRETYK